MIYKSYYWKKELIKLSRKLTKRLTQTNWWTEVQHGTFEKEIMIGFYIIRKLIEANKLSNEIVSTKIKGFKFPNIGKTIHVMNNHRFYEFFNFDNPKPNNFNLIFLANQIVHSYLFSPSFDPEDFSLNGIHFSSDKDRNTWLYEISIDTSETTIPHSAPWNMMNRKKITEFFKKTNPTILQT